MDKIDRLLDAMEHPERNTPTEIEAMRRDPEVREVFDLLDKTKSSLQTVTTPDIDEEWKRFEEEHRVSEKHKFNWLTGLFSRNAAASIAIAIASFTAVAAIVGVGIHHLSNNQTVANPEEMAVAVTERVTSGPDTIKPVEADNAKVAEIIVFDDEPLETILNRIAGYYDCELTFNNEASKSLRLYLRWNQALPVGDVVERLNNFEQIRLSVRDKTIKVD